MELSRYQALSQLASKTTTQKDKLMNGVLGLCAESGLVAGALERYWYGKKDMDYREFVLQLGKVLQSLAEICAGININLDTVALNNLADLRRQEPKAFKKDGVEW